MKSFPKRRLAIQPWRCGLDQNCEESFAFSLAGTGEEVHEPERGAIAEAAVKIADADGIEAASMRRVAAADFNWGVNP